MSEAIKGIRRAAKQRARADELRHKATDELRDSCRAHSWRASLSARIAREAGLSRQGVYDLLGDRQPA